MCFCCTIANLLKQPALNLRKNNIPTLPPKINPLYLTKFNKSLTKLDDTINHITAGLTWDENNKII